jgi:hypothetical protein
MARNNECPSCGNIYDQNLKRCLYCGSSNPNYGEQKKYEKNFFDEIKDTFNSSFNSNTDSERKRPEDGINYVVLIVLVIVFWPAAIIYALVKMQKK